MIITQTFPSLPFYFNLARKNINENNEWKGLIPSVSALALGAIFIPHEIGLKNPILNKVQESITSLDNLIKDLDDLKNFQDKLRKGEILEGYTYRD